MRTCRDCGIEISGRSPRCDACRTARRRQQEYEANVRYCARHPERKKASFKKFYDANADAMRARRRDYGAANKEKEALAAARRRAENLDEILEREHLLRLEQPDRFKKYRRTHYEKHREKILERGQKYKAANYERLLAYAADYWRDHPELNRAHAAKRRAAEKRAMPIWADFDKMLAFYKEAVRLTRETGIPHHVDHIYPLQSKTVCGLHCHTNLQVVPATVNLRKKNRVPELDELPRCCAWPSIVHFEASRGIMPC